MGQAKNIAGRRFGRVTATRCIGLRNHNYLWFCVCDCGVTFEKTVGRLTSGRVNSCGCWRRERAKWLGTVQGPRNATHKLVNSATYRTWSAMVQRTTNPKHEHYRYYGGRGISVCERWRTFELFLTDMGIRPVGRTIDRIKPDGNYELGNCRWATPVEQRRNRR